MKRVIVESPYRGAPRNKHYLEMCIFNCLCRNESPYASHLMLTGVLDDANGTERALGIQAGFVWRDVAHLTVFYCDLGWSEGMKLALTQCRKSGLLWEPRTLWTPIEKVIIPDEPTPPEAAEITVDS